MHLRWRIIASTRLAGRSSVVVAALLAGTSHAAEPCPANSSGAACTPVSTPAPAPAKPLFELLSAQAANLPQIPSEPAPWFSGPDPASPSFVTAPLAIKPADQGFTARTSVANWRDYNAQMLSRRIDQLKATAPKDLKIPKANTAPPFDMWSSFGVDYVARDGKERTRSGAGADYKISKSSTVGMALEQSEQAAAPSAAGTVDRKISAYASTGTKTTFKVDAKAETHETAGGPLGVADSEEKTTLGVAPRVAHKFALDGGQTLEPFVKYEQKMSLGAMPLQAPNGGVEFSDTAGAGVSLAKPDSYSLSATTDVENLERLGSEDVPTVKGKLQLTLPLP